MQPERKKSLFYPKEMFPFWFLQQPWYGSSRVALQAYRISIAIIIITRSKFKFKKEKGKKKKQIETHYIGVCSLAVTRKTHTHAQYEDIKVYFCEFLKFKRGVLNLSHAMLALATVCTVRIIS